ncbi:MAG: ABC transporter substrate-binding protein [Lachnospiraceae bacterium]|nr:ABC transporter substrate-binding protein [Lachnospiraceae bacterium]
MNHKRSFKIILLIAAFSLCLTSAGCSPAEVTEAESADTGKDLIVVGFSQVGAESDWRSANSESMRSVFTKENGYELIFEDAQQKQTNQITAIRSFIQQDVDYIVVAPVTETGWDTVLSEAKEAGIPVIIVDRQVEVSDDSLFTCWIGSDFELEGKKVCMWMEKYLTKKGVKPENVHIVDIQGTMGSTAQIGRTKGFDHMAKLYGWDVVTHAPGDFTKSKAIESMFSILRNYDNVNVVYCENDNEALGVIEVLEASGKKCGSDIANGEIMVVSFDGVNKQAVASLKAGQISCIGECNPMHGPRVETVIQKMEAGEEPYKYQYVNEELFTNTDEIPSVMLGGKEYKVTVLK